MEANLQPNLPKRRGLQLSNPFVHIRRTICSCTGYLTRVLHLLSCGYYFSRSNVHYVFMLHLNLRMHWKKLMIYRRFHFGLSPFCFCFLNPLQYRYHPHKCKIANFLPKRSYQNRNAFAVLKSGCCSFIPQFGFV